jgi:Holliday junction resolvase RusA-like endonuclease
MKKSQTTFSIPVNASYFLLPVQPVPASRPRIGRFGAYYGKNYEAFRTDAQPICNQAKFTITDRPLRLWMECVVTKPKQGKLRFPRGDIDNYIKGPLDVMTKAERFWNDDDQIVELLASKRYCVGDEPCGIHIWFEPIEDKPYK